MFNVNILTSGNQCVFVENMSSKDIEYVKDGMMKEILICLDVQGRDKYNPPRQVFLNGAKIVGIDIANVPSIATDVKAKA